MNDISRFEIIAAIIIRIATVAESSQFAEFFLSLGFIIRQIFS